MTSILNWLKNKLIDPKHGIIIDSYDSNSFDIIQDFLEGCDRQFKTSAIYYQAFPEESALDFLNTLEEELSSKLQKHASQSQQSLASIIKEAELKIVIIDRCHLHPQDTTQNLIDFFSVCGVTVVLVGYREQMAIAKVLSNPKFSAWDKLEVAEQCECIPELR